MSHHYSRRKFLQTVAVLGAGAALGFDGFQEYSGFVVEAREIRLRRLPPAFDGFRLVQISDIHFGRLMHAEHLRRVVEAVNAQKPDLVAITGDFVTATWEGHAFLNARNARPCAKVLEGLQARFGRVAVMGNHDCGTDPNIVSEALVSHQIQVLRNRALPLEIGEARLWMTGLDDVLEGKPDAEAMLHGIPPDECVLAAVHEPDSADRLKHYPVDLQISGHSHGGQIRFPVVGPLYLPPGARKYSRGHYDLGSLQLYTSRGIGVIHVPFRFMCPPEITVLTLRQTPRG